MDFKRYRQNVHDFLVSMTFFQKIYLEGSLSESVYELIEVILANKFGLSRISLFRDSFKINPYKNIK